MSSINNESIQSKTEKLTKLVAWFDSEDFDIEEALEKYRQAEVLAREIETDLTGLKNEVQILKKKFDE